MIATRNLAARLASKLFSRGLATLEPLAASAARPGGAPVLQGPALAAEACSKQAPGEAQQRCWHRGHLSVAVAAYRAALFHHPESSVARCNNDALVLHTTCCVGSPWIRAAVAALQQQPVSLSQGLAAACTVQQPVAGWLWSPHLGGMPSQIQEPTSLIQVRLAHGLGAISLSQQQSSHPRPGLVVPAGVAGR